MIRRAGTAARLLCAMVAVTLIAAGEATACAICLSNFVVTPGQQLGLADQVVLAVPAADEGNFQVVEVVKGNAVAGGGISEPVSRMNAAERPSGKPLLLLRNDVAQQWTDIGAISREYAGWLRQLSAIGRAGRSQSRVAWTQTKQLSSELTEGEWHERVALVLPYLENSEPLAADIAYGEISRAPYSAIRSLKGRLDPVVIRHWVDDPKLASRRSTYTLLLGIAGTPDDAALLEQSIDTAQKTGDARNLAATLAADLELRGPSRVGWIEATYLTDGDRTLPEIEAALLALSVHGGASGAIPRERVVAAYRLFIQKRKAMAGFVAQDLADWGSWEATSDYAALLKADVLKDPASHFAVVSYLHRSPHADAKAALQWLDDKPR